jgi:RHS repeat-associated protein
VITAAKDETASALLPVLLQTRVWGVAPENATAIGPEASVSSTLRLGSWQIYDGTASARLVGLGYFGARYNSGAQGRFTTPDPVAINRQLQDPQLWNKYAYVGNRPHSYIDPDGKWPFWIHDSIIDRAFSGVLSRAERRVLQAASSYTDRQANQDAAHAYEHRNAR